MSLEHLVLAIVEEAPAHGYAIHVRLNEALGTGVRIGRAAVERSRVYRALGELERSGRLQRRPTADRDGRGRLAYRLLPAGTEDLRRWLERPRPDGRLLRRSFLVQLLFSGGWEEAGAGRQRRVAIDARIRRRDRAHRPASTEGASEGTIARVLRLREALHLEAEIRILSGGDPLRPSRRRPDRSSASR